MHCGKSCLQSSRRWTKAAQSGPVFNDITSVLPVSIPILANTPGGLPPLDSKLDDLTEHDIARTMARHNFTFALSLDYNPPTLPTPLGDDCYG